MKYFFSLILLSLFCSGLASQSSTLIFANAVEYPEDRYDDYSGTPYFFKEWVFADIYSQNGDIFPGMVANYNIDNKVFEIRNGKDYVVLDPYFYWCVRVDKDQNGNHLKDFQDSTLFIRGLMADDEKKFVNVIYNGVHIKLLRDMYIAESVKTFQNVGQTITNKRFNRRDTYHLVIDGEYKEVKLKKKDFIKVLGHKDELEQWLKDNKNKFKRDQDFSDFLAHVESTYYIK